jgi:sulfite reductase alpha subunit-like flavoprotein
VLSNKAFSFLFKKKKKMEDRTIVILYGSETGCAQDMAENLSRQARRRQFRTSVFAMDDYDKSLLVEEKIVIFVCSTSGQGSEPTNMKVRGQGSFCLF